MRANGTRRATVRTQRTHAWAAVAVCLGASGCASSRVPDPHGAVLAYAAAAERGDADALYGMMRARDREERGLEGVRALVAGERAELEDAAKSLRAPDVRVTATTRLRFADGEEAALDLEDGRFRVTAAGALPGGGRTPEEALDELRRVLARRSYAGLMRVLTPATRAAIEGDLRALVDGLSGPAAAPLKRDGDSATAVLPGGHRVKLRREAGVWRVEDFD